MLRTCSLSSELNEKSLRAAERAASSVVFPLAGFQLAASAGGSLDTAIALSAIRSDWVCLLFSSVAFNQLIFSARLFGLVYLVHFAQLAPQ